ncbi:MAG: hypothetical protein KDI65_12055, partial [Alphaproteobacteria bacterium]|nr:hypothetical protein [Alphaproteobacteria bacterium]
APGLQGFRPEPGIAAPRPQTPGGRRGFDRGDDCLGRASGACSLWSLERYQNGKVEKCQTIEVDEDREIVQCAGHSNRDPSKEEIKVVRKWAESARLKISDWVFAA